MDKDTADTQMFLLVVKPYEFLTAMTVKNTVFWNITSFIVLESCQSFEKKYNFYLYVKRGGSGRQYVPLYCR